MIAEFGLRNESRTGRRADGETGRRLTTQILSPRLPFSLSPRLNNPQSEIRRSAIGINATLELFRHTA